MKNVTIALNEETHRRARIVAAEMGTSLSALVKAYLETLGTYGSPPSPSSTGVRDMQMTYTANPAHPAPMPKRQLGQMKGEMWYADDFDTWPDDIQAVFDKMLEGSIVAPKRG